MSTLSKEMPDGYSLYRTSDIYFASYLAAIDLRLMTTEKVVDEKSGKTKTIFVFSLPTEHVRRLKTDFFTGSGTVQALKYSNSLRTLKGLCYA